MKSDAWAWGLEFSANTKNRERLKSSTGSLQGIYDMEQIAAPTNPAQGLA
jgi:hypothetical protein